MVGRQRPKNLQPSPLHCMGHDGLQSLSDFRLLHCSTTWSGRMLVRPQEGQRLDGWDIPCSSLQRAVAALGPHHIVDKPTGAYSTPSLLLRGKRSGWALPLQHRSAAQIYLPQVLKSSWDFYPMGYMIHLKAFQNQWKYHHWLHMAWTGLMTLKISLGQNSSPYLAS